MGFIRNLPLLINGKPITEITEFSDVKLSVDENNPNPEPLLSLDGNASFTGKTNTPLPIFDSKLSELVGSNQDIGLGFTKYVQRRKHRKRRINKKWAKRYGYKKTTVNVECENVEIIPKMNDNREIYAFSAVIKPNSVGDLMYCTERDEIFYGNPKKDSV
jgi:hypothetical protein